MDKKKKGSKSMEKPLIKKDEIDLIEIGKTVWEGRKLILKVTAIFLFIGLVVAFSSKEEFEAECKLMPESQEGMKSSLGGLAGLAGMAGINLDMLSGGGSGALTPDIYPEIAKSAPFLINVWTEPVRFESYDTTVSSYQYFMEIDKPSFLSNLAKYTVGLPFLLKDKIQNKDEEVSTVKGDSSIIRLSPKEAKLLANLRERIIVEVDANTGIIVLTCEMPDALASAEVAQLSIDLLTKYITDYKVSKSKVNFDFVQSSYNEAKATFENSQRTLARFNDHNRNVVTALAQTEAEQLQNEYNINYELYKGLATQLEQAKISLKEKTPVFTVLEPVRVPIIKSQPKKGIILVASVLIGIAIGIGIIFGRNSWEGMKGRF